MAKKFDNSFKINEEQLAALKQIIPEAVKDGFVDIGALSDALSDYSGDDILDIDENLFGLYWPGKRAAKRAAAVPPLGTLVPVPGDGVDEETTRNIYIEGDNLEVLKIIKKAYSGRIKMIYIDPPYNTGNDFVYNDDFSETEESYKRRTGQIDESGNKTTTNSKSDGRFHSKWCSMMYPRLRLAHGLLSDDGVIFISIDDNEVAQLRKICNELFGEDNFVGQISVINNLKGRNDRKNIATCHEYLLIFGKHAFEANGLPLTDEQRAEFDKTDENGNAYQLRDLRKRGRPDRREDRPNMYFPIYYDSKTKVCSVDRHPGWIEIFPLKGDNSDGRWRWGRERVQKNLTILEPKYSVSSEKWGVEHRVYLNPSLNPILTPDENDDDENPEERQSKSKSFWIGGELSSDVARRTFRELMGNTAFDYPKAVEFIKKTLYMGVRADDIVLDFFSGSSTTAHAVMQLNAESLPPPPPPNFFYHR
jgi:adenine-specific DNA-methyltransferase